MDSSRKAHNLEIASSILVSATVFYVYCIQNTLNLKVYIGKATERKNSRFIEHIRTSRCSKKRTLLHKALLKYGDKVFTFQILEQFDDESEALDAEMFWINFFRSNVKRFGNDYGYNLTDGGDGIRGHKHSEETKRRISASLKSGIASGKITSPYVQKLRSENQGIKRTKYTRKLNVGNKIDWPANDVLVNLVKLHGFTKLSRMLNVSNVAIRERLVRRNLYPWQKSHA